MLRQNFELFRKNFEALRQLGKSIFGKYLNLSWKSSSEKLKFEFRRGCLPAAGLGSSEAQRLLDTSAHVPRKNFVRAPKPLLTSSSPFLLPRSEKLRKKMNLSGEKLYIRKKIEHFRLSEKKWKFFGNKRQTFGKKWIYAVGIGIVLPCGKFQPLNYSLVPTESAKSYSLAWASYEKSAIYLYANSFGSRRGQAISKVSQC